VRVHNTLRAITVMKIIQFMDRESNRSVGIVKQNVVHKVDRFSSTYELFQRANDQGRLLEDLARAHESGIQRDYDQLAANGDILVPLDHPDPYHTWITGTGLTHKGSAESRDSMHDELKNQNDDNLTDSMKMFQRGLENGTMADGNPGSQPEWFYKGNGLVIAQPGQPLKVPDFSLDGGEEPEIAGLYVIDRDGEPRRLGFCLSNEFSDHQMERMNYLYLAHSKLRPCSYGPELLTGELPREIMGTSRIYRAGDVHWEREFYTGEENMTHNISNLEYHHFKYDLFRQPGDVHIHMFGTSVLSFQDGIETRNGDQFEIEADCFNLPLRNRLEMSC